MRISYWSSDVCSSDLSVGPAADADHMTQTNEVGETPLKLGNRFAERVIAVEHDGPDIAQIVVDIGELPVEIGKWDPHRLSAQRPVESSGGKEWGRML